MVHPTPSEEAENNKVLEGLLEMILSTPRTRDEFERYYDLRFRVLREPWGQPRGSEKDALEDTSLHVMATEGPMVVGVGRGQMNTKDEAQIRYMAVEETQRCRGIGGSILAELESMLREKGAVYVVLDVRESAVDFYKRHGYEVVGKSHTLFGVIPHYKMCRTL